MGDIVTHYSTADCLLTEKKHRPCINKRRILTPKMLKHQIYFFLAPIPSKKSISAPQAPLKPIIF
jgi:hypothetical protein